MAEHDLPIFNKRGYLPHYDSARLTQFITFRLADSLPVTFVKDQRFRLETRQITEIEYHRSIEKALDLGEGPTFLRDPRIAKIVAETLIKFDGKKYVLRGWMIMPNHVHLLLRTIEPFLLADVVHSIKSFTANAANKILSREGRFWSPDYFDRFIRDQVHLANVKRYIDENPVKAGLCSRPANWPWGSAGWKD